jgi:CPA2 family monovalent cation:H+ antiporter-2
MGHGVLALLLIFIIGRWIMRPLFKGIARFHSDELFTLTTLFVILGSAWVTHYMGLSLALGAFVAGMLLGETEFRHQLEAEIRPFRDVLLGLFFITVGMLFDVTLLPEIWAWVLLLLFGLIIFKLFLIAGLCRLAGWDAVVSMRTGLVLAHGGEFGFAILTLALSGGLLPEDYGQVILAALLISMAIAPLLIRFNSQLVVWVLPRAASVTLDAIKENIAETAHGLQGHVILCGYGRVGQRVARFLEAEGIKYIAMDIDPFLVENAVKANEPVSYGNASNVDLIKAAGLSSAAVVVFCLDDVHSVLKALPELRRVNNTIPVLVRTEDDALLDQLTEAGATEVVPATMEASLMLSSHVLFMLGVPAERVMREMRKIRQNRYALLRKLFPGEKNIIEGTDTDSD